MKLLIACGLLLMAGCGGAEGDNGESAQASCPTPTVTAKPAPAPVCEAGRAAECPCPDGTKSAQECAGDGTGWLACACNDEPSTPTNPTGSKACSGPATAEQLAKYGGCPSKFPFARTGCDTAITLTGACWEVADGGSDGLFCCSI
jgi:hypothetical protein